MVQDRAIFTMANQQSIEAHGLSNGAIFNDLDP